MTPTTNNNPAEKAAQEEAAAVVDTSSPLDLCPIPVYPSVQEFKSLMSESEESEDDNVSNQVSIKEKGNGGRAAFTPHSVIFHPHLHYDSEY